jgi:hypothetical protein
MREGKASGGNPPAAKAWTSETSMVTAISAFRPAAGGIK